MLKEWEMIYNDLNIFYIKSDNDDRNLSSVFQQAVASELPPSFEVYVERLLQDHRNKLD
jgi:hypothetical protein